MSLFSILKSKYLLVTVIFLAWIIFFAQYDIVSQYKQRKELNEMREKINYLEKEVSRLQEEKKLLKEDPVTMEKYAREKYYMKSKNEDVYVFDTIKNTADKKH